MTKIKIGNNPKRKSQPRSKTMEDTSVEQSVGMAAIVGVLSRLVNNASARVNNVTCGIDVGFIEGVKNIQLMMKMSAKKGDSAIPGTGEKVMGLMAFRREMKALTLAFVGGPAPAFYLPLDKLILMVEQMHDRKLRTVIIRNCSETSDSDYAQGQVLAKFNVQYSALQVNWGDNGVVVKGENDINRRAVYYISPDDLLLYYMAAKVQLKGGPQLEALLQANEGWRKHDIPTNPLDPGVE